MKAYTLILFLISCFCFCQNKISCELLNKETLIADKFISKDNFNSTYIIKDNSLIKITALDTLRYSNFQLGNNLEVNTFNPLKINLFYSNFNTVIILDNRLAEIAKVDFNTIPEYKNISHITTGFDNTIWVFNQDFQQLELFDFKTLKTRYKTIPVSSKVLSLTSNYNYCWLLTQNYLYCYNYFGSLVYKLPNNGFINLQATKENLIIEDQNGLSYYNSKDKQKIEIEQPNMLINQFFVTNQILYIYTLKTLYKYQLKTD